MRQERYDTTGIQGAYFDNSVTYSGTGANIGNIFIKGEDSNNVQKDQQLHDVNKLSIVATKDEKADENNEVVMSEEFMKICNSSIND